MARFPALTFGFFAAAGAFGAEVLWDNGARDGRNAVASERNTSISEASTADDLILPAAARIVRIEGDVFATESYDYPYADWLVYAATDHGPGELVASASDQPCSHGDSECWQNYCWHVIIDVPNLALSGGRYYLVMRLVGEGRGRAFWFTAGGGEIQGGSGGYFKSEFFGFPEWTSVAELLSYDSDFAFTVYGNWLGDLNCDRAVDFGDLDPFVLALSAPEDYKYQNPECDILLGDLNGDGSVDFNDIDPFVVCLVNGWCP